MKKLICMIVMAVCIGAAGTSSATLISSDLPVGTYITKGNLDWAWVSPVNEQYWGPNELMLPGFHAGWRFATDRELASRPTLAEFGGGSVQAVAYWNTYFTHVDPSDYSGGYVSSFWGHSVNETLYVRDLGAPVPEPATVALMGLGLAGLLYARRKKNA